MGRSAGRPIFLSKPLAWEGDKCYSTYQRGKRFPTSRRRRRHEQVSQGLQVLPDYVLCDGRIPDRTVRAYVGNCDDVGGTMDVISDALAACRELASAIYADPRTPEAVKDDLGVAIVALNRACVKMVIYCICRMEEE